MTVDKRPKYLLISMLMILLFNFPLLSAANKMEFVGNIPLLYLYIAIVWPLSILLLYLTVISRNNKPDKQDE